MAKDWRAEGLLFTALAVAWAVVAQFSTALAQPAWPAKPIRLLIPYEAGGLADRLGRLVGDKLSERLGHRLIAENRGGSAGLIAASIAAHAPADGYTLMVGGSGPHVTGPATNRNADYDPIRDFTHIAMLGGDVFILAANPGRGWHTLADLAISARAPDARLDYGSTGIATPTQIIMEIFLAKSGLKITHIPYKGAAPAIQATLGGHTPLIMATLSSLAPLISSGRLTALGVTTSARHAAFPAVLTFAEQGFPDVEGGTLFWLSGPARLPAEIVTRLNSEVRAVLKLPDVREALAKQYLTTRDDDAEAFQAFVLRHVASWTKTIKELGIIVE